jgi:hypothetical protein
MRMTACLAPPAPPAMPAEQVADAVLHMLTDQNLTGRILVGQHDQPHTVLPTHPRLVRIRASDVQPAGCPTRAQWPATDPGHCVGTSPRAPTGGHVMWLAGKHLASRARRTRTSWPTRRRV